MAAGEDDIRTILITGATDGIGLALAQSYASRGHKVLATGRRAITDDFSWFGSENIRYVIADQSNPEAAAESVRMALLRLGWKSLDVAILNAGNGQVGAPEQETTANTEDQIAVNLTAPILIARGISEHILAARGRLVLIGSTAMKGAPQFATYAATKAGLAGFARSMREEWRGRARVQMIIPGPVRTQMHSKAGLEIGAMRYLFMTPKTAARSIERAIRKGDTKRKLGRLYGWRSRLALPRKAGL